MLQLLMLVGRALALALRGHRELVLENLALRQQLMAMKRANSRPRLQARDRLFWIALRRIWTNWRTALVLVRPETVVGWHRTWLRRRWTRRSTPRANGRPPVAREIRALVREMATANPLWGAPRIHGELRTLGVDVSERTVSRLLTGVTRPPSQTWRTFLTNHLASAASMDFFTVPTLTGRVLFVVVVLSHHRRRILHLNTTAHPTAEWAAQQVVEAFPDDTAPALASPGSRPDLRRGLPAPRGGHGHRRGPVRAGESLAESVRRARDRLDPTGVSRSRHRPERVASSARPQVVPSYYHRSRTHLGLDKDTPDRRPVAETSVGPIIAVPEVGGLHHRYERRAA